MTVKKFRQQMKPRPLVLSQTGANIPPSQSGGVNTKGVSGQHFTPSHVSAHLQSSMTISTANTSSPTNSAKKPAPTAESPKIAAVLFRSTVLALMAAGLIKQGADDEGNTVIVLPRQHWQELRLK